MMLFPEGKSKAVSGVSLAAAVICAIMSVMAARDLLTLMDVFSTPAFYLGLVHATLPIDLPPLASFMVRNMRLFFVFLLLFWLSGLTLALGVWARKDWGRQGAAWMLYLVSAAALLTLIYPWVAVPRPLMYGGVPLSQEFNDAVRAAAFFARAMALLGGGLCLWGALSLDRGSAGKDF